MTNIKKPYCPLWVKTGEILIALLVGKEFDTNPSGNKLTISSTISSASPFLTEEDHMPGKPASTHSALHPKETLIHVQGDVTKRVPVEMFARVKK